MKNWEKILLVIFLMFMLFINWSYPIDVYIKTLQGECSTLEAKILFPLNLVATGVIIKGINKTLFENDKKDENKTI